MNEKSLIFIFTVKRQEYYTFLQDICYRAYGTAIRDLTDFILTEFQFKHYWEKEKIRELLYDKFEVCGDCYLSNSDFSCISGDFLNCRNSMSLYIGSVPDCNYLSLVYSKKYDGTIQISVFKNRTKICNLNICFDNKYSYECNNLDNLKKCFKITEHDLHKISEAKSYSDIEKLLSKLFGLPFTDKLFSDFVSSSKKHESFGVGGSFDLSDDSDESDYDFLDTIDTFSPKSLAYSEKGFEANNETDDFASLHIITDNADELKRQLIDFNSDPVIPEYDEMDYYEKQMLNQVFSVLGNDFYDEIKKGTALSRRLEKRKLYCIKGHHNIYSLYSNAFFYDTAEGEIETYFSCSFTPYVIVFGYCEGEEMSIKLYRKEDIALSEIIIFSAELSKRNIWKNPGLICSLLDCDELKLRKSVDKNNLKKTCDKWASITGLPLNVSYNKIAQNPDFYDAQKWN